MRSALISVAMAFIISNLQIRSAIASCPGTGTITTAIGTLNGPSSYQANDNCKWILMPPSSSSISLSMVTNNLVPGDQIIVSQCIKADCSSIKPVKTFTSADMNVWISAAVITEANPIMQVNFQGGSTGTASSFTMSFTSEAIVYCVEKDCSSHCAASTATTCSALPTCSIKNSDPTAAVVGCSCVWQYKGETPAGGSSTLQPDYQTNGSCQDFGNLVTSVVTAVATGFATVLVRTAHPLILFISS
jgi:hypothetical protein